MRSRNFPPYFFRVKKLSLLFCLQLALTAVAADTSPTNLTDRVTEANIARSAVRVLERYHYSQLKFDDEVSSKFLNRYFESLDPQRLHFFQSDLDDFEKYKDTLDDLILRAGDTEPAHLIFDRLLQRAEERVNYVEQLLKTEKFDFKGNDRYMLIRKDAPWPKNQDEARQLWRQQLRAEYLQEKLSLRQKEENQKQAKRDAKKNKSAAATKPETNGKKSTAETKDAKSKEKPKSQSEQIVETLTKRYDRMMKSLKELSPDEVFEIYLTALAHVYDPHSDYMGHAQMENFQISMKLSLFGIGAVLTTEDGYCKIQSLVPGPAMRSKQMKPGDRVIAVAQADKKPVDCIGMKLNKVVEMIRGEKGTEVRLTVIPVDATDLSENKVVTLIRDEIKLEDKEAKAKIIETTDEEGKPLRLGILDLPSFYEDMDSRGTTHKSTSADMMRLLKKLNEEKVSGIILDLRANGGGALNEAINLTGLFIKRGPVVQTKDPNGRIVGDADRDPSVLFDGPMIVLTSRFSASASEILAGALQDYGRALVVGDSSTHGKGTVQQLLRLKDIMDDNKLEYSYDPGSLKFTIRKFYRPSGSSTQLKGVVPDLVLPSVNNFAEVGEVSLEDPLPWDEVSSAKFEKLNRVDPYLAELKKHSDQRIARDKDFSYIRDDIERFKKALADKSVSLNEDHRFKEMQELKTVGEARKKERQARKTPEQKFYEITLKNAELPGLPPPGPQTNETAAVESATEIPVADVDNDEEKDDKSANIDVTMEETKRILADYISLMSKKQDSSVTLVK